MVDRLIGFSGALTDVTVYSYVTMGGYQLLSQATPPFHIAQSIFTYTGQSIYLNSRNSVAEWSYFNLGVTSAA